MSDKTPCRTPAIGRDGVTNIPTWKFDLIRGHILGLLDEAGGPMVYNDVRDAVGARLTEDETAKLGKLGWHCIAVKLEMEVRGEIIRVKAKGPQQIAKA